MLGRAARAARAAGRPTSGSSRSTRWTRPDAPEAVLRLYWTPGRSGRGAARRSRSSRPFPTGSSRRARGASGSSRSTYPRRSSPWLLPGTKSVSYATHIAAEDEARRSGAPTTPSSSISTEPCSKGPSRTSGGARATLLVTPALELGILAGETRAALLALADELGYGVEHGRVPARATPRGGRGVHVVVRPRGDAGDRRSTSGATTSRDGGGAARGAPAAARD